MDITRKNIGIVIITYNIPSEVFTLQIQAIQKYCMDEFTIEVFDNSSDLASKYILQGGVLDNGKLKFGIGNNNSSAYSLVTPSGNIHRLGIRPMPGIVDVDIKSKSLGSKRFSFAIYSSMGYFRARFS